MLKNKNKKPHKTKKPKGLKYVQQTLIVLMEKRERGGGLFLPDKTPSWQWRLKGHWLYQQKGVISTAMKVKIAIR